MDGEFRRNTHQHLFDQSGVKPNAMRGPIHIGTNNCKQFPRDAAIDLQSDIAKNTQTGVVNDFNLIS
jgi:hypothetical protein